MIRTALYYPYNYISRPLLCTALLLWDRLEFIAPRENLSPETADPLVKEAFEIIAASHLPNEYEKQAVHKQIQDFLAEPSLPKSFFFDRNLARSEYGYIRKRSFLTHGGCCENETWFSCSGSVGAMGRSKLFG